MVWFLIINIFIWLWCIYWVVFKKQSFKTTPLLLPWGIFVTGDGLIIGLFWSALFSLRLIGFSSEFIWLGACLFWMVRSGGEVIYWLLEQFASVHRNKPEHLFGYKVFKDESIWFIYQIAHQCILALAALGAVYFAKQI